jgi:hypothetical protein
MIRKQSVLAIFAACIALVYLLPFIIFRENSYITVHDFLDSTVPWLKMFRDDNLFFKLDAPTRQFDGLSTLYYAYVNYSIDILVYAVFDIFTAYIIHHSLALVLGFISMFILLNKQFNIPVNISLLVAVCYAVVSSSLLIATATLPLIGFIFLKLIGVKKFNRKTLLLVFFPFFSSLTMMLWFVLGIWLVLTVVFSIKGKRPNYNLIAGLMALIVGSVFVDIRLFYFSFFVKEPLLRGLAKELKTDSFLHWATRFLIEGYADVATAQEKIILPLAVFGSIYIVLSVLLLAKKKGEGETNLENTRWIAKAKRIFVIQALILAVVLLSAVDYSGVWNTFLQKYIPFLVASGFIWGRIYILNRLLWYTLFAFYIDFFVTEHLKPLGISVINYNDKPKLYSFNGDDITKAVKVICLLLIFGQIKFAMQYHGRFNDAYPTFYKNLEKFGRVYTYFLLRPDDPIQPVSYREFYSVDLFNRIKKDMNYRNEKVAALGYHAAVLTYNGFNTIDGYSNMIPLEYYYRFRKIVEPDFESNEGDKLQFEQGDGKLYLFNKDLTWKFPGNYAYYKPVKLNINTAALVNDFECEYILSAAEILNAKELDFLFLNSYKDDGSIYNIYLYKVAP